MFLKRLRNSGFFPSCHFRSALQSLSPTTRPPPPPPPHHQVLTSHALHRTLAVLPLPFRAIEPPERERETRGEGKRKSNKQRCIFCIRIHYKSNWIGRDHIWNCSGLQCDHISARCVKAVCPHENGRKKKIARQVKKVV